MLVEARSWRPISLPCGGTHKQAWKDDWKRSFGQCDLAIALTGKGASRENDCKAIGGSVGGKRPARVREGEKSDRSDKRH